MFAWCKSKSWPGGPTLKIGTDPQELLAEARGGNKVALARLISIIEYGGSPSRNISKLCRASTSPYCIGITGAPGAGKSTLVSSLTNSVLKGWPEPSSTISDSESIAIPEVIKNVAILAVDPSSPFSGGAILADRVRMQEHATDPAIFIRSMATRGHLGGLSLAVPDALRLLGAVGMSIVLLETVGVGQMEVEVAASADTTVVVLTPGWGDSMQANKAGLIEIADVFVINKADRPGASEVRRDLEQMLDLSKLGDWRPPIVDTVALDGHGTDELWSTIGGHKEFLCTSGNLEQERDKKLEDELRQVLAVRISEKVEELASGELFAAELAALKSGKTDPYEAADRILIS